MVVVCGWFNSVWSWFAWTGLWGLAWCVDFGSGFLDFRFGLLLWLVGGVLFVLLMLVVCGWFVGVCGRLVVCVL